MTFKINTVENGYLLQVSWSKADYKHFVFRQDEWGKMLDFIDSQGRPNVLFSADSKELEVQ